jgi:hypothetical protein
MRLPAREVHVEQSVSGERALPTAAANVQPSPDGGTAAGIVLPRAVSNSLAEVAKRKKAALLANNPSLRELQSKYLAKLAAAEKGKLAGTAVCRGPITRRRATRQAGGHPLHAESMLKAQILQEWPV